MRASSNHNWLHCPTRDVTLMKSRSALTIAGIGVLLFVLTGILPGNLFLDPALRWIPGILELWWILVALGAALYVKQNYGLRLPGTPSEGNLKRQDIIESTNWSRENKHAIRKTIGVGLVLAGGVGYILSTLLGLGAIEGLWILSIVVGVVLVALAWRRSRGIKADHTREVSVRLPDQLALHTFHVKLRQVAEDKGYTIGGDTSPGDGGRTSAFDDDIFHSHGSFTARRRPIAEALSLLPDDRDESVLSNVVTAIPVGFLSFAVGLCVLLVTPGPGVAESNEALYDAVHLLGILFMLGGVGMAAYGYVRRTREWGELYCVEEGTVYSTDLSLYDEETLTDFDHQETPNVAASDSACELVVTLGATCTNLYDEEQLVTDLNDLADAVESIAEEQRHEFFGTTHRSQPGARGQPSASAAADSTSADATKP